MCVLQHACKNVIIQHLIAFLFEISKSESVSYSQIHPISTKQTHNTLIMKASSVLLAHIQNMLIAADLSSTTMFPEYFFLAINCNIFVTFSFSLLYPQHKYCITITYIDVMQMLFCFTTQEANKHVKNIHSGGQTVETPKI